MFVNHRIETHCVIGVSPTCAVAVDAEEELLSKGRWSQFLENQQLHGRYLYFYRPKQCQHWIEECHSQSLLFDLVSARRSDFCSFGGWGATTAGEMTDEPIRNSISCIKWMDQVSSAGSISLLSARWFRLIVKGVIRWVLMNSSATCRRNPPKCFVNRGLIIFHQLGKVLF